MKELSLKERFPGVDMESVVLQPDSATELTYSVLLILKELTACAFRAATTRRAVEAQGIEWGEVLGTAPKESGAVTDLYISDRYGCSEDCSISDMAQRTLEAVQAAKGHKSCDIKQKNTTNRSTKQSVMDYPEFLITEQMLWEVIAHTIVKSNGPFEMGESIVAFNTFEGYDPGRDYVAEPPSSAEEQELVDGIEELVECFTFSSKRLSREVYQKYIADCQKFQVLILNYVIRELELCELLKPLGQVQLDKGSEELSKLFLIEVQPTVDEEGQARWALPYKHILSWADGDDKVLLMVECIDYRLDGDLSDMYISCTVLMRSENGAYELEEERYSIEEQINIVLGFQELLELFVVRSSASMKRYCDYIMAALNAKYKELNGEDGRWLKVYEACNHKAVSRC